MTDEATPTTRAAAAAASVRTTDVRPGRHAVFAPAPEAHDPPGEAENDFIDEDIDNPDRVTRASSVRWAADTMSPCYSHLLQADAKSVAAAKSFDLTRRELDLLIEANAYQPVGHGDTIAFGIRGATLRGAEKFENVDKVPLADARPNHVNFRCVMGRYNLKTGKLWAYTASTVPWHQYMESGLKNNLLPTGCYIYKLGTHAPATKSRWVTPALRLSDAKGAHSGLVTVLRTTDNRVFEFKDKWDQCAPSDNVHCAYSAKSFSSLGCQTIKGGMNDGLWADFQKHLKTLPANARVDYVLFTGAEIAMAATILAGGSPPEKAEVLKTLGRLRFGSEGDRVERLQAKLGLAPTGYFGASTMTALIAYQEANKIASDGIYSTVLDAKLGWAVFDDPPAPIPLPPLPAVQPAPQPAPAPAEQPPPQPSPPPVVADAPEVPPAPIPPTPLPPVSAPVPMSSAPPPEAITVAALDETASSATLAAVAALAATRMPATAQEPVVAQNTPEAAPGPVPASPPASAPTAEAAPAPAPSPEPAPDVSAPSAPVSAGSPAPIGEQPPEPAPAPAEPPSAPVATPAPAPDAAPPPVAAPVIVVPTVPSGPPPAVVITSETLHEFAPRARADYLTVLGGEGNDVLSKFGINKNTLRFCHFMAQVGHECGGFTIVEENLNYSAKRMVEIFGPKIHSAKITAAEAAKLVGNKEAFAERVYGLGNPTKARDLGNTQPGDGYRYRGRGFLQITGRSAYREMGKRIGVDLEANPDLAGQPLGALMTAAAFWDSRKLNTYADQNNIDIITKRINGGHNGLADRKAKYRKAVEIWGDEDHRGVTREGPRARGPRDLQYGDIGSDVLEVKRMLSTLGYDGFTMDEDFSKATHLAVASFQIDRGLDGDGVVDAETRALLERDAKAAGYVPQTPGSEHPQWPPRPYSYNVGRGHAVWVWGVILLLCAAALLGLKFFENPRVLQSQSFRDIFDLGVGGTIGLGAIILIALGRRIARSSRRRSEMLRNRNAADDGLRREPGGD